MFSWETLDYEVKSGLSQVSGINLDDGNAEAAGKSSIFNILCWTLFGKIPKDVRIDEVIRQGQKSCEAVVELKNGHSIVRKRNPNDLYILPTEGFEGIRGKDSKETQQIIEKLIGLSFDTFCQSVYFSQNHDKKFITSNEIEKAKILSDIQELEIFDKARNGTIKLLSALSKELEHTKTSLWKNETLQTQAKNDRQFLTDSINQFQKLKDNRISELENEISGIQTKLQLLEDCNPDLLKSLTSLLDLKIEARDLGRDLEIVLSKITDLQKPTPTCSECGNSIDSQHINEHLENYNSSRMSIKSRLIDIHAQFDRESTKHLRSEQVREMIEETRNNISQKSALSRLMYKFDFLLQSEKLSNCSSQSERLELRSLEMAKLSDEYSVLKSTIATLLDKKEKLELLKDGFREIKSHIFGSVLADLSIKATDYAFELFEVPVSIRFRNDSEGEIAKIQTIIKVNNIERSLGLLSGGQARRVQIATDLALSEIVSKRAINPINFRILDESSKDLSTPTIERLVTILEKLGGNTIIVDHNPLIKASISETFDIEYKNGVSTHVKS